MSGTTDHAGASRRDRQREQTLRDLKQATLAEIRERGAVAVSLRSVARRMAMSPAGLYRYVGSREELLTLLIAEGYQDLGHHLEVALGAAPVAAPVPGRATPVPPQVVAADGDAAERLRAVALAYRWWAVDHPNEFGLLFGDPIPGYDAPAGGPTVEGMTRVGTALAQPVLEAWRAGRLRAHPALAAEALTSQLAPMAALEDELPGEVAARLLLAWGRLHGQVSLEVFGHHRWLFPDGCEALYRAEVEVILTDLLLDDDPSSGDRPVVPPPPALRAPAQ